MSSEQGATYKCADPSHAEEEFVTNSQQEMAEHRADGNHIDQGSGACAICGKQIQYENVKVGKKPVCDECKAELAS